jgi:hypothetical protein
VWITTLYSNYSTVGPLIFQATQKVSPDSRTACRFRRPTLTGVVTVPISSHLLGLTTSGFAAVVFWPLQFSSSAEPFNPEIDRSGLSTALISSAL